MKSFRIYIQRGDETALSRLIALLRKNFKILSDHRIGCDTYAKEDAQFYQIACRFRMDDVFAAEKREVVYGAISRSIAEYIVEHKEWEICEEILEQEASVLERSQRRRVMEYVQMFATGKQSKRTKIDWIAEQTKAYCRFEKKLCVEGFIRFRLKQYRRDLRRIIQHAIDEYFIERELGVYVETLKNALSNRETKLERLHVVHLDDRNLYLYDHKWRRLFPYLVNGVALRLADRETDYADLVVGVIVSLAPRAVIVHTTQENYPIIYTIKKVFAKKAIVCSDCSECRRKRTAK